MTLVSYSVTIGGAAVEVARNTLEIEQVIDTRSVASLTISDRTGAASYRKGQPVLVYDGATLIWGGVVGAVDEIVVSPTGAKHHQIRCVDWHYILDKRIASKAYASTAAGDIVSDLITSYLAAEGVTAGVIDAGPAITECVLNYVSVTRGLTGLRDLTGFWFLLNPDKSLDFCARSTNVAPRTLEPTEPYDGTVKLTHANPQYRNRQYVKGVKGVTDAQTEIIKGDGENRAFTVGFRVARVPTVEISLAGGGWSSQTVGIKGLDDDKQWYWSKGDAVLLQDSGETVLGATDRVRITYQGEYDIVALSWDAVAIATLQAREGAGTGYVEDVAEEPELSSREAAFQAGASRLARYAMDGRQLRFTTSQYGYQPGQLLTVNLPSYNLAGVEMLIESVTVREQRGRIWYAVTAVEGPVLGSWTAVFEDLLSRGKTLVVRENISETQVLITSEEFSESWTWAESVTQTVYACPVPSTTLYPSASTYPC